MNINQWGLTRNIDKIKECSQEKGHILHFLSTLPGQSGAPIIGIDKNNTICIIGVHKGGVLTNKGKASLVEDQQANPR